MKGKDTTDYQRLYHDDVEELMRATHGPLVGGCEDGYEEPTVAA